MTRIPLILFGDGPRLHSGLARIARDLATRLQAEEDQLGIRVLQVGVDDVTGWDWTAWPFWGFQPNYLDQGRGALSLALQTLAAEPRPIVLSVCDPARVYDLTRPGTPDDAYAHLPMTLWSYFPVDAHDTGGGVSGPAAQAVWATSRPLAYTAYGAEVLQKTIARYTNDAEVAPIPHLPHGIDTQVFNPRAQDIDQGWGDWYVGLSGPTGEKVLVVGCVATNQPRKDLGVVFATIAELQRRGCEAALWLHTDRLTDQWDIGTLAQTLGLRPDRVFVSIDALPDAHLATRYALSDVTIAPGLGEGFGYPIVESLACGTPVVHVNYAGGAEFVPQDWRIEPSGWRLEGSYALFRPVLEPAKVADAIERTYRFRLAQRDRAGLAAYCAATVAHLDWTRLWPSWQHWIQDGLRQHRRGTPTTQRRLEAVK